MPATPSNDMPIADTFGWDTVYAIRYADVNSAIVNDWPSHPLRVDQTSGPASIAGDFLPWRIVTGGSGRLVHLETPVPVLTYNDGTGPRDFDATPEIELELEFVPQPAPGVRGARTGGATSGGSWMDLRVKGVAAGANAAVRVLDITYTGTQPGDIEKAIIMDLFRQWFENNIQEFATVFASVNLNAKADVDQFQWLMPTHVSYAVAEESSLPDGIFGVLCMTEDREYAGLAHQVSPYAIPEGQRSAFLISPERYLSKMLMPGIGLMFAEPPHASASKPWPEGYFDRLADGSITNNAPISIAELEIEEGQTREATIPARDFTVRISDSRLEIDFTNMKHDYRHGLLGWLKVNHTIRSTAKAALRDGQKFALEPSDGTHTIVVTKNTTAEWVEIVVIGTTLLLITSGLAVGAYRTWTAQAATQTANAFTQTGELVDIAAVPAPEAAQEAAAGAQGCMSAVGGGLVRVKDALSAFWQNYRATWMAAASTATGGTAAIMKILEAIANKDSQKFLPDFKVFSAGVMAPVQWPNTQSEFEVETVAFNRSFQVSGDPGFAD
jgi:hypothetical protein